MGKRLAVFVEGQTEQIFMERMLVEVAGSRNIALDVRRLRGSGEARSVELSTSATSYYALICDCGADNRVVSDLLENYEGLTREGYSMVLGLRDVAPAKDSEIPGIRALQSALLPNGTVPVHLVLAVRETEAWFIVEDRHYSAIHPELNAALILEHVGIDTATIAAESIEFPAKTLHEIYRLKGRAYQKRRTQVEQTVTALDFKRLHLELSGRVSALRELFGHVNKFFE
jgi:hypothetical protein